MSVARWTRVWRRRLAATAAAAYLGVVAPVTIVPVTVIPIGIGAAVLVLGSASEAATTVNIDAIVPSMQGCKDCPVFIKLPADARAGRRIVYATRDELTWKNYYAAVDDRACPLPDLRKYETAAARNSSADHNYLRIDWPITLLRPAEISCYLRWIQAKVGKSVALPTPLEWEWLARGGRKSAKFPWGNDVSKAHEALGLDYTQRPSLDPFPVSDARNALNALMSGTRVGRYAPNGWGLNDMMGNNFELTAEVLEDEEWRRRTKQPALKAGETRFRRVSLKGSNWVSDDWISGITQIHYTPIVNGRYMTPVAVRLIIVDGIK